MSWSSRIMMQGMFNFMNTATGIANSYDAGINKLGSSKFQASQTAQLWGKVIPITYGKRRITGQPLQSGIMRQKTQTGFTTTSGYVGGAFRGSVTETRANYQTVRTATFAYVFGAPGNPLSKQRLMRLWVDGMKVYDAATGEKQSGLNFAFFDGNEEQMPDATLNQERYDFPVAYRGLMYVVFYDYVVPEQQGAFQHLSTAVNFSFMIEAEFWEETSNPIVTIPMLDGSGTPAPTSFGRNGGFDSKRGYLYNIASDNSIWCFDVANGVYINKTEPVVINTVGATYLGIWQQGYVFFVQNGVPYYAITGTGTNSRTIYLINADTGEVLDGVGANSNILTPSETNIQAMTKGRAVRIGAYHELAVYSVFGDMFILRAQNGTLEFVRLGGSFDDTSSQPETDSIYVVDAGWKTIQGDAIYNEDGTLYHQGTYTIMGVFQTGAFEDLIVFEYGAPAFRIYRMKRNGTIVWEYNDTNSSYNFGGASMDAWRKQSNTEGQFIAWQVAGTVYRLDMMAGTIDVIPDRLAIGSSDYFYDNYLRTIIDASGEMSSNPAYNGQTGNIPLSSLLRNLAIRQGYANGDITITGIDDTIIGAAITQIADLSAIIDDLKVAYNFEVVKRGRKILFTRRAMGGAFAPDGEIAEADRAILEEQDESFITLRSERTDGTTAPGKIQINFIDPDLKFVVNTVEHARNDPSANLSEVLTLNLPIIMTPSDAATLAARIMIYATEGRMQHEFLLSQRFSAIEPGDYYELTTAQYVDVVKITDVSYNADHSLLCKAEAVSTQIGPTVTYEDYVYYDDAPRLFDELKALVLDTTLLVASDQQAGAFLESYAAIMPAGRSPVGIGVIAKSDDPQGKYAQIGATTKALMYGFVSQAIDDFNNQPNWQYIEDMTLSVRIAQGDVADLVSVTYDEMLAGANRLLVGKSGRWELIGYTDVTYNAATKRATFSGLVRGLRGTDAFSTLHEGNDYVVFVDNESIVKDLTTAATKLDDEMFYAGVNAGGYYELENLAGFIVQGNARKPWAVANVELVDNAGDIDVTWTRRTRLTGPLVDGTGAVPLDEASELYEADIYRSGSIVRTVTGIASEGFSYTAAQMTADGFGGMPTELQIDIYQISAVVGRGFVKAGTYYVQ